MKALLTLHVQYITTIFVNVIVMVGNKQTHNMTHQVRFQVQGLREIPLV